ncbi:alanine racemase [uncultured Amnibacterium sp.]|uniref:alanine racemase n=1 Tax=uncultured Amnibacterium sp. TaxID=1631851 RepID=UPI0035CC025F
MPAEASARIELELAAFRHNVALLAELVAPARTMIAVKADAYGHGMLPFARAALEVGAHELAVLEVPAGLALRQAGITVPLFAWLHGRDTDFAAAIAADIDLGVSSLAELDAVLAAGAATPAAIHLKIDTGLHRNGASAEDWPALVTAARTAEQAGRVRVAAIWSHLADASPEEDAAALGALLAAVQVARDLGVEPPLIHLAASSAGIREPAARLGMVRFGIAAYGISPFDDVDGAGLGLRPVISLHAPVLHVEQGVATLGVGSADGIPPSVVGPSHGGAAVLLAGTRRPVTAIGVDTMQVGIGDAPIRPGQEAVVFGSGGAGEPTAEEWAGWAGTIGDEIVARASGRIPRRIIR